MNIKHWVNGMSLRAYCHSLGMSESRYKMILWLMNNKFMTFEEAIAFKRPPAQKDQRTRKRNCSRRFLGYSDEELKMSVEEAKHFGAMKKSKWTIGDKTLKQICKERGLSYNTIRDRIVKQNMSVKQALDEPIVHPRKFFWKGQPINKVFDKRKTRRVYGRVTEGWSLELACELPVDSFHNRKPVDNCVKSKFWRPVCYGKSGVHSINS